MFPIKVESRILLNCPHCKLSSRYDTNFITDAIHDHKEFSCVACGGHIQIVVVGLTRAAEHRNEAEGEQTCPLCHGKGTLDNEWSQFKCQACDGTGQV